MTTEEIDLRVRKFELKKKEERLNWILGQIKKHMIAVGMHLNEIRDEKLYEPKFKTFEEFCNVELGFSIRRANQIISGDNLKLTLASEVKGDIAMEGAVAQLREGQLRELGPIPEDKRVEVLREVVATGKPTAARIKRAKARIISAETGIAEPEPAVCPACHRPL